MKTKPFVIAFRVALYSSLVILCLLFALAWAVKNGIVVLPPAYEGRPATTLPPSLR